MSKRTIYYFMVIMNDLPSPMWKEFLTVIRNIFTFSDIENIV